jgi:hypothetical protein
MAIPPAGSTCVGLTLLIGICEKRPVVDYGMELEE